MYLVGLRSLFWGGNGSEQQPTRSSTRRVILVLYGKNSRFLVTLWSANVKVALRTTEF